jgi:putative transposase
MIRRGFKYRLYATAEQKSRFVRFAGVCRAVDNAALFQREHFWRRARPSYASQCRELTPAARRVRLDRRRLADLPAAGAARS